MKTKWIFGIVAVMAILSIFSISQGADRFYYGSYDGEEYPVALKDSLRFNIVRADRSDSSEIQNLADHALRAIVANYGDSTPTSWSYASYYTLWEAEGLDGSYYGLSYDGGTLINDASASGGKAMCFSGPDSARLIQWGPTYYQFPGDTAHPIQYSAEFRLKYFVYTPLAAMGPGPPTPLCSLKVVDSVSDSILKHTVIYKSDFAGGGGGPYQTFTLENYTVPNGNRIEFQIYWFGIGGRLFIDYVRVYDEFGYQLMSGLRDTEIMDYVSQAWTKTVDSLGDTTIYRWYMRDEPRSIDCYMPTRYIDNLLDSVSQERTGFQAFSRFMEPNEAYEYLLRQDPTELCVDRYPMSAIGEDTTGNYYQGVWTEYCTSLDSARTYANSFDKDFWFVAQAFRTCDSGYQTCDYPEIQWRGDSYCPRYRDPSRYEIRLQTFLPLCYGADAILYFRYQWWEDNNGNLLTGLYDPDSGPTHKWREIKEFTGPRVEKLGTVLNDLTWEGACSDDSVGSFTLLNDSSSYIDNIVPHNHYPPYAEVGFFTHPVYRQDHFMLVNRRCLSDEEDTFSVYIQKNPDTLYSVFDMYDDSEVGQIPHCWYSSEFNNELTVPLRPGEGRLLRLVGTASFRDPILVGPSEQCTTIQQGIDAVEYSGQIVLVDTGTYCENIDFGGNPILVTTKFHTTGDTSYISRTIIDGSQPEEPDSASVVRFVSGEDSCATLMGFTLKNGGGTLCWSKGEPAKCGGGIFCAGSSPTIIHNIIMSNTVTGSGGGIYCDASSSPRIAKNIVREDSAASGGGISGGDEAIVITDNLILSNNASAEGGGIDLARGIITNNTIDGNSADLRGGGIYVSAATCQITNNIIANGQATNFGGIYLSASTPYISYNDLWNNENGHFSGNDYGDTSWGENRNGTACDSFYNILQNPNYIDGYHLGTSSPCVDAGDNGAPALLPTDFDGDTRVMDDPENDTFFVDMGAYEYQPEAPGGPAKIAVGDTEDTESKSSSAVPEKFSLSQNYPNPFNPTTVLEFDIAQPARVRLKIYNILGQLVRVLVDQEKTPGSYTVYWDGNDKNGRAVSSGIYFYKIEAGEFTESKKMVILK